MKIQDFINKYEKGTLKISTNVSYDLKETIEANRRLFHSKYKDPQDTNGLNKFFYNIGMILWQSLYNPTDIDTKDINLRSTHWRYNKLVDLLKLAVKTHLRLSNFGSFINKVRANMIKDGTCVVKMVKDHPEIVDLLNIVEPAHQSDPQNGALVERMFKTKEWLDTKKDTKWYEENKELIDNLYEKMQTDGVDEFQVYEYWHRFEINGEQHKGCKVYLDNTVYEEDTNDDKVNWIPYIQIDEFKTPYKNKKGEELYPYKKVHMIEVEGRAIGFGVFELVRGIIEHFNELWNVKRKKDRQDLAGTYLFKKGRKGSALAQEFLNNREIGAIVEVDSDSDLQKLAVDRFTADIINSADKLFEYARMIVGANAVAVGDQLPASMPATTSAIMDKQNKTTYDVIIEQMALFLTEFFEDFYMDVIIDELDKEEMAILTGDPSDFDELDRFYAEQLIWRKVPELKRDPQFQMMVAEDPFAEKEILDGMVMDLVKQLQQNGDSRFAQIKKKLIKEARFIVEVYVNNDTFDKNVQIQNMLQIARDPMYMGSREKLYNTVLDLLDMGGKKFEKSDEEKKEELIQANAIQQGQGGGGSQSQGAGNQGAKGQGAIPGAPTR